MESELDLDKLAEMQTDYAIDEIMEYGDRLFREGKFAEFDEMLLRVEVNKFSSTLLTTWVLVAWWAARNDKLENYNTFYKAAHDRIHELLPPKEASGVIDRFGPKENEQP